MESLSEYLEHLASANPTPGGGSAATIVAAMAAALIAMVARISAKNPKYAHAHENARRIAERADRLRADLLDAATRDEAAFGAVMATRGEERQQALARAAEEPLRAMRLALEVERLADDALGLENRHLASDLGAASELASASLAASAYNVRINHRSMRDDRIVERQRAEIIDVERESATVLQRIRERLR